MVILKRGGYKEKSFSSRVSVDNIERITELEKKRFYHHQKQNRFRQGLSVNIRPLGRVVKEQDIHSLKVYHTDHLIVTKGNFSIS